jgi:hypothetical protein
MQTVQTRLTTFMQSNRIRPGEILKRVTFSRSQLDKMRKGRTAGSAAVIGETRAACAAILGRHVGVEELFDFAPLPATGDRSSDSTNA